MQCLGNSSELRDEAPVIGTQSKELTNLSNTPWDQEFSDGSDQPWVWPQPTGCNDMAEVLDLFANEVALYGLEFQSCFLETLDDELKMF